MRLFLVVLSLTQSHASASSSSALALFEDGKPSVHYSQQLEQLTNRGGEVRFSDGHEIFILRELGRGGTTSIYLDAANEAVRLAAPDSTRSNFVFLAAFAREHQILESNGVIVPRLLGVGPRLKGSPEALEYVRVQAFPKQMSLSQWIAKIKMPTGDQTFEARLPKRQWQALKEFAKSTWKFANIADLSMDNLIWTGKSWVLLDWSSPNVLFKDLANESATVFSARRWSRIPRSNWGVEEYILSLLDGVIKTERAKHGHCNTLMETTSLQGVQLQWNELNSLGQD